MLVDVFIHGATPCALMAAIAAARAGCTVVVQAPENGIGGAITGGLGIGDPPLDLANWGGVTAQWIDAVATISGYSSFDPYKWNAAPSAFLTTLTAMIEAEPNITLRLRESISSVARNEVSQNNGQLASRVAARGDRIKSVTTVPCHWLPSAPSAGDTYEAHAFIDGSYNGGLMMRADVPFRVGRESASEFGEQPYAGVLADGGHTTTQAYTGVDARGNLTKYAGWRPLESFGQADRRYMALGYRNCVTNQPGANNLGFPAPPGYDAADFADDILIAQQTPTISVNTREHAWNPLHRTAYDAVRAAAVIPDFETLTERQRQNAWWRHNGSLAIMNATPDKFVTNGSDIRSPLASEMTLTRSDRRRHEIREQLAYRELGRLHTLQNHPDVPEVVRARFAGWGLCADEWQSDYILRPGWPSEVYEREGRRLIGQETISFVHGAYRVSWPDQICYGAYFMDSKAKSVWPRPYGGIEFEGHYAVENFEDADGDTVATANYSPLGIPLSACVAPVGTCDNLAVCWGISATELAFSMIRLEPFLCAVGEAIGHAAVASVQSGIPLAMLPYARVRARLDAAGLPIFRYPVPE